MRKYLNLLAVAVIAAGCNKPAHIVINGKAPGLTDGVYFLKDASDSTIAADNITAGAFKIDADLPLKGYGHLSINKNGSDDKNDFEVYLEGSEYTVEADANNLSSYPKITTTSKIQNELSAYYKTYYSLSADAHKRYMKFNADLKDKRSNALPKDAFVALVNRVNDALKEEKDAQYKALKSFVEQNPNNIIAPHLMANIDLDENITGYNAMFGKLSTEAKNTDEGKEIGEKLSKLSKLMPGAVAPEISGTTPDGKPFNIAGLNKKGYIVDFWRASTAVSRQNHQELIESILKDKRMHGFGVISVSFDSKRDWWTNAIAQDKMNWPQFSDLKGDDSPNLTNWSISRLPAYYLVDSKWRIIERDVPLGNLLYSIDEYAVHH